MKKKRMYGILPVKGWIRKLLRIMRLSLFLICWSLIQVSASTYSQNTRLDVKLENASIKELFKDIKSQSEFTFVYNVDDVEKLDVLTCSFSQSTVEEILNYCLSGTDMTYVVRDKVIIISPKERLQLNSDKPNVTEQSREKQLKGTVFDTSGNPLPGAAVLVKGTTIGTITDFEGMFNLSVPVDAKILVFSFVGYKPQEIPIGAKTAFSIVLEEQAVGLDEVVAVGYGTQKKASVVGAIANTTGEVLKRSGGVSNLAQALSGNLLGVTTVQTNNQPGKNDPLIYIRGRSTWNGGQPYVLVDGVERRMNDIDMSEVENLSVLKDASATAVYGVKGANGVILVTTKRGSLGKAKFSVNANSTYSWPSKLVDKLDAYDTRIMRNDAIEREVVINEGSWADYTPMTIVNRYRNPGNYLNLKWPEAYPNVDWQKETIKNGSWDHRINMNVAGGSEFVKYFGSLAYYHQGDIMKIPDSGKGYHAGYGYDRFNFRSNLDITLSRTTLLKVNLGGANGIIENTGQDAGSSIYDYRQMINAYRTPPDAFMLKYSSGRWGIPQTLTEAKINSAARSAISGVRETHILDITSDFALTQQLDFITKGLSVNGSLSFDNHFETQGGVKDVTNYPGEWQDPRIEDVDAYNANILLNGGTTAQFVTESGYILINPVAGKNQFDFVLPLPTPYDETGSEAAQINTLRRRLFYQLQANYARTFGKNEITATGVFTREQLATGSEFQRYREDWVFRTTYNYDGRYFAEFNGAYNGSEKFGPAYRFDFFPSAAVGWTISQEKFLKDMKWLDKLKVRYSYGLIGDDGGTTSRWLYSDQWSYSTTTAPLGEIAGQVSPYGIYTRTQIGNPDIHWEKATKSNAGFEMSVLDNLLSANIEYFTEDRTDILLAGTSRTMAPYYGATPPTANVGRVSKKGYEIELKVNKRFSNNLDVWGSFSVTHAVDKVLEKEEPELLESYLKEEGYQIGQPRTVITAGFIQNWDDLYTTTQMASSDNLRLPGNYNILDYNSDGKIDSYDRALFGYPADRPQNDYTTTIGLNYKGFGLVIQFYGVNNVIRSVSLPAFQSNDNIAYASTSDYWTKQNPDGVSMLTRWKTQSGQSYGNYFLYDGSYLRLKRAELGYTFEGAKIKKYGMGSLRLYVNGNNLLFWSDMPDDRESGSDLFGGYPSTRRVNFGIDINF